MLLYPIRQPFIDLKNTGAALRRVSTNLVKRLVALGGVVVSVPATGPKVAGSNPAEDDGF
jgi:hypothetical protein